MPEASAQSTSNPDLKAAIRRSRIIAAVVVLVLVGLVAVFATRPSPESRLAQSSESALIGTPAPDIKGTAIDGSEFSLEQNRGRWVVVNFFATWCQPCIDEHPELVAFEKNYASDKTSGPVLISVAYQDKASYVADFFARNGGSWRVLPDDSGSTAVAFGARGLPETFVVDPNGVISAHVRGGVTMAELAGAIK